MKKQRHPKDKKSDDPKVKMSKALTYVLRHKAIELGLKITSEGFVSIEDLFKLEQIKKLNPTLEVLQELVDTSDKKRFEMSADKTMIRATQGHSIEEVKEEGLLEPVTDYTKYPLVLHGSFAKFWASISANGLSKMKRNHIHMTTGYPGKGEVISGMRADCNLYIEIDLEKCLKDGIKFFESKNKVILSPGVDGVIPKKYFKKVILKGKTVFEMESKLPLEYLLVLDFEANTASDQDPSLKLNEIIEFPVVIINIKEKKIVDIFHRYVKPEVVPAVIPFCTELTGITQDMVDKGIPLEKAIVELDEFLTKMQIPLEKAVIVTCGDWDLRTCLRKEARFKKIPLPSYLAKWINLKKVFSSTGKAPEIAGEIAKEPALVSSMAEMLEKMGLPLVGKHHSGIDDAKNIAQIILKMLGQGFEFKSNYIDRV